ncbi:MAG: response regulator transcription factor [Phycisphaerales bacterium JB063]
MANQQTVYVVDDDAAVRDSLQWLLESVGLSVKSYGSANAFLAEADQSCRGCLVVDLRLPGLSGLDLMDQLNNKSIQLPTIMITGHGDVTAAVRAMKAGAIDFIEKPFNDEILLDRVRAALAMDIEQFASVEHLREIAGRAERLTPREVQVMGLVVQGKLNKQIATELGLSHKTIEVHRAHVMEKMQAGSLAELVRMSVALEREKADD